MFWDLFWTPSFGEGLGAEVGFLSIPEVGWKTVSRIEQSPLWAGILAEVDVFLSHRDAVLSVGDSLLCLASSAECWVQAFQHKERPVWGIQFHSEMPVEECARLLVYRRERHPELVLDWGNEHEKLRFNVPLAQKFFDNFLDFIG